jgi:hypothetical protein
MRAGVLRQFEAERTGTTALDLDRLDDREVDDLYHATLRKIVVDSRRGEWIN